MNLQSHAAATSLTAVYPGAGTGNITALTYLALGLSGEATEVVEKLHLGRHSIDEVSAELGDVSWYLSRLLVEVDINIPGIEEAATDAAVIENRDRALALVVDCGRVGELIKKALRDDAGEVTIERRGQLAYQLTRVLASWFACHNYFLLDPQDTWASNLAKLASRRARGVLQGSGDNR